MDALESIVMEDTSIPVKFNTIKLPKRNAKRSAAWSYFDDVDDRTMRCLICGLIVKKQKNTSGMLRHLRAKHTELLPNVEKEDDFPPVKRQCSPSPVSPSPDVASEWMSSIIIEPQPDGCLGLCHESHVTPETAFKEPQQEYIDFEKKKLSQLELQNDNFAAIRRLEYQVEKLNDNVFTLQNNLGSKLDRLSSAVERLSEVLVKNTHTGFK